MFNGSVPALLRDVNAKASAGQAFFEIRYGINTVHQQDCCVHEQHQYQGKVGCNDENPELQQVLRTGSGGRFNHQGKDTIWRQLKTIFKMRITSSLKSSINRVNRAANSTFFFLHP